MSRKTLKTVLGFSVAFAILGVFTWAVGWEEIINTTSRASLPLLGLGGALIFGGVLGLGVTWWYVIREVTGYSVHDGVRVFLAAQFANGITPLGQLGGEPFIAYVVSRDSGVPYEKSFGAVLAADILNTVQFFTFSLFGILLFLYYYPLDPLVAKILRIILVLIVLAIGVFVLFWKRKGSALQAIGWAGGRVGHLMERAGKRTDGSWDAYFVQKGENFYGVLENLLQKKRTVGVALVLSHASGLLWAVGLYVTILSLGVDAPLSALLFILPISLLTSYLPLPGGLGGIEIMLTLLLAAVTAVPAPTASAAALLFRVFSYWLVLLVGGVIVSRLSVDIIGGEEPASAF